MDEGDMHDVFKMAYITPIYKRGSKMNLVNYRPVSQTLHVMKIFERVIKVHIIKHLEEHKLVRPNQHGFASGRSTQTQLLQHYSDVMVAIWRKKKLKEENMKEWKMLKNMKNNLSHRKYIWTWFNLDAIGMELKHEWSVYNNKLKIINIFQNFQSPRFY